MKTTTVRLDDVWVEMVDYVARQEKVKPSDVLREAVRRYMLQCAEGDPNLAKIKNQARDEELAENETQVLKRFGDLPSSSRLSSDD